MIATINFPKSSKQLGTRKRVRGARGKKNAPIGPTVKLQAIDQKNYSFLLI